MKKFKLIYILLAVIGFAACEPNEDIYKQLDEQKAAQNEIYAYNVGKELAPSAYTLTEDDYKLSSNTAVSSYKNFSASALPKDFLPEILNKKFSAEDGFEMMVTYNFYESVVADEANAYELSSDDYAFLGESYSNFSDEDVAKEQIAKLMAMKTSGAEEGSETTAMYTLYKTNMVRYIRVNADNSTEVLDYSSTAYELTDTDYEDLGEGTYHNFTYLSNAEDGVVELAALRSHTLPKEYAVKVYRNYLDKYVVFVFDGANWSAKQSVMPVTEPLNFALNTEDVSLSTWWADPAIKLTLGKADYDMFTETSKYQNFDLRGSIAPGTDRGKLVEMIGQMLDANHSPVDGQQYLVTYAYYDGSSGVDVIRVLRTAGVWAEHTLEVK